MPVLKTLATLWLLGELHPWAWLVLLLGVAAAVLAVLVLWPLLLVGLCGGLAARFYLWRLQRRYPKE